jgi:hypothetical protein
LQKRRVCFEESSAGKIQINAPCSSLVAVLLQEPTAGQLKALLAALVVTFSHTSVGFGGL